MVSRKIQRVVFVDWRQCSQKYFPLVLVQCRISLKCVPTCLQCCVLYFRHLEERLRAQLIPRLWQPSVSFTSGHVRYCCCCCWRILGFHDEHHLGRRTRRLRVTWRAARRSVSHPGHALYVLCCQGNRLSLTDQGHFMKVTGIEHYLFFVSALHLPTNETDQIWSLLHSTA